MRSFIGVMVMGILIGCGGGGSSSERGSPPPASITRVGDESEDTVVLAKDLSLADLNQDGLVDIAMAESHLTGGPPPHPGFLVVILQDADRPGHFLRGTRYGGTSDSSSIGVADFNDDNRLDVVVGSHATHADAISDALTFFFQSPDAPGEFALESTVELSLIIQDLGIADIDQDGHEDVVVSGGFESIVLVNDGQFPGQFIADQVVSQGAGSLAVGDLDADGAPDLVLDRGSVDTSLAVFLQEDGWFVLSAELDVGLNASEVEIVNLDADQRPDLVVANNRTLEDQSPSPSITVLLQQPAPMAPGMFRAPVRYSADNQPTDLSNAISVADFNADGLPDVATIASDADETVERGLVTAPDPATRIAVFLQTGEGLLGEPALYLIDENVWDLKAGDMNGDGLPDIVVSAKGASVLFNDAQSPGRFRAPRQVGTEAG